MQVQIQQKWALVPTLVPSQGLSTSRRNFAHVAVADVSEHEEAVLELGHDTMEEMMVDGYPGPGEYVRPVIYDAPTKEELDAIIARAHTCEQYIRYVCYQSKLLTDACGFCQSSVFVVHLCLSVVNLYILTCCYFLSFSVAVLLFLSHSLCLLSRLFRGLLKAFVLCSCKILYRSYFFPDADVSSEGITFNMPLLMLFFN